MALMILSIKKKGGGGVFCTSTVVSLDEEKLVDGQLLLLKTLTSSLLRNQVTGDSFYLELGN